MSLLQGADALDPKGPQGRHPTPTPQGTQGQGDPTGPGGREGIRREPKGTQRDPRAPSAPLGGWALWGLFRGHSEWKAMPKGPRAPGTHSAHQNNPQGSHAPPSKQTGLSFLQIRETSAFSHRGLIKGANLRDLAANFPEVHSAGVNFNLGHFAWELEEAHIFGPLV